MNPYSHLTTPPNYQRYGYSPWPSKRSESNKPIHYYYSSPYFMPRAGTKQISPKVYYRQSEVDMYGYRPYPEYPNYQLPNGAHNQSHSIGHQQIVYPRYSDHFNSKIPHGPPGHVGLRTYSNKSLPPSPEEHLKTQRVHNSHMRPQLPISTSFTSPTTVQTQNHPLHIERHVLSSDRSSNPNNDFEHSMKQQDLEEDTSLSLMENQSSLRDTSNDNGVRKKKSRKHRTKKHRQRPESSEGSLSPRIEFATVEEADKRWRTVYEEFDSWIQVRIKEMQNLINSKQNNVEPTLD